MLAEELTKEFGKNFSRRNLFYYRKFYEYFPDREIVNACVHNLTWTHYRALLRVSDENARLWYLKEASEQNWASRTLDRNIATQYYYRLLQSPKKEKVIAEMKEWIVSRQFLTKLRSNLFIPRHLSVHGESVCKPARLWLAVKTIGEIKTNGLVRS